jgi:hypothetical protein
MLNISSNQSVVILGRKRMGKTTLAQELLEKFSRRVSLDPQRQIHSGLIFTRLTDLQDYMRNRPHSFHVVARLESHDEIDELLWYLYEMGDIALHVDEFNLYWTGRKGEPLADVVDFGRNHGITLVTTAKRPFQVPRLLTSQADFIVSFRTTEKGDLEYFKDYGFDLDALRALPEHEYLSVEV